MDWLLDNMPWIFSGIGVTFLTWLLFPSSENKKEVPPSPPINTTIVNNNTNTTQQNEAHPPALSNAKNVFEKKRKELLQILFIDDDTSFKVVGMLKKAGWSSTKIVSDLAALDQSVVRNADVFLLIFRGLGKS
ncbi:MAG: hypothetical protein A2600_05335 [Candidatus Lambdaproteobacteria bacterium RIFOXYD1_FULL_56_27]|uniref:Uncharacterized protein n=1 Tax=Candidatus Lambdaproteobacteria bacterium RIFOXYD2_FULL_56_26 TaxID=1817773 RepID=A0A1F6GRR7_9PROT|nr:MAG: hypothetical protein A2426_08190 [Candidatus Lambdaproteobacteria bacterium RIFOXYC1_FULL_56_13]OGH00759.1 MAG: hypothetical protein A2557_03550 [Candidatus Lambdaproteobacteria bacterium RIFOXYD2_FULL_56_26]OGH09976.1 MAG: hypothetical protein A2600_05335 [Candidatus Lambdaproteobacteria bacterium RIFOXYD1_FULL_56_27]